MAEIEHRSGGYRARFYDPLEGRHSKTFARSTPGLRARSAPSGAPSCPALLERRVPASRLRTLLP